MRLLTALDFPSRELGRVEVPLALATACQAALERLSPEPPRERFEGDHLRVWVQQRLDILRLLSDARCSTCSVAYAALEVALYTATSHSLVERETAITHVEIARNELALLEGESVALSLGRHRRQLLSCTVGANAAGFGGLAEHCERLGTAMERELAWLSAVATVSARTRAWQCGVATPTAVWVRPPQAATPDAVLVVEDHRPGTSRRFDRDGTREIVSAVRRRLADILRTDVYEDAIARAIQADALVGQSNGLATCARPLSIEQAYADATPSAVLVQVAPGCERDACTIRVDLDEVVDTFHEHVYTPVSIVVPPDAVSIDDWIATVRTAPIGTFVPPAWRDVGGHLGPRAGAAQRTYPRRGDVMISEVTYGQATRQRVATAEAEQRLADALAACEGTRTDLRLGVETHVHVAIDGRGYFAGATATSEDPARARCAERAFDGLTTTCPLGRAPAEIELIACSYPAQP